MNKVSYPQIVVTDNFTMLMKSFERTLLSENKSPKTIKTYLEGIRFLYDYLKGKGMPIEVAHIRREHVESYIGHLLTALKPGSVQTRYRAIRIFFNWLLEEGEIKESPMRLMHPPKAPINSPEVLSEDQLRAILKTCAGKSFIERRDTAIIRLLIDTGMRRMEITNIILTDIDWNLNVIKVTQKGGGIKACPFGRKTAVALDRYLRLRTREKDSALPNLWIGKHGAMGEFGIYEIVRARCKQAGLEGIHPHLFRHTFAHSWLASGGSETSLQRLGGWKDRSVMSRYGASAAESRARDEFFDRAPGDRI